MLSYKEYKLLNESLYGAFNLGIKNPNVIGGIVSSSNINGTEAALEAEAEEAIEEAKKMKKKMDCGSEEEDMEDDDMEKDEKEEGEEDSEDEESDEDGDEEADEENEEEPKFMKKKMLKGDQHKLDKNKNGKIDSEDFKMLKKKSKKEWSEIVSDLEAFLEDASEEESLFEIKKGLELIKEGMKKHKKDCECPMCKKSEHKEGMHKKGCDCKLCKNSDSEGDKEDGDEESKSKGLSAAQKKLPKALQDAILAKQGKGKGEDKKCGKYMKEEEASWWNSVNNMLNADPDQKNWDGVWTQVGEVQQAIRENQSALGGGGYSKMNLFTGGDGKKHMVSPGDTWDSICKEYYGDSTYNTALFDFNKKFHPELKSFGPLTPGMTVMIPDQEYFDDKMSL
jgi:nucleoid-associated protein YgaU